MSFSINPHKTKGDLKLRSGKKKGAKARNEMTEFKTSLKLPLYQPRPILGLG